MTKNLIEALRGFGTGGANPDSVDERAEVQAPPSHPLRRASDRPSLPGGSNQRVSPEEYVLLLLKAERHLNQIEGGSRAQYMGCHWIISGARDYFRRAFPNVDDVTLTDKMVREGRVFRRWAKAGPIFFLPEDWQERTDHKASLGEVVKALLEEQGSGR